MAITFGRSVANGAASPVSPLSTTVTINAGETGVAIIVSTGASLATVTGLTGGGTWTQRAVVTNGTVRTEIWSTAAGAATAATTVDVAFTGTPDTLEVAIGAYVGVVALGITTTGSGAAANPSLALTTQDANNWVVYGVGTTYGVDPVASVGTLRSTWGQAATAPAVSGDLGLVDNTAAAAGSVTGAVTQPAASWGMVALELRSVAAGRAFRLLPGLDGHSIAGPRQFNPSLG